MTSNEGSMSSVPFSINESSSFAENILNLVKSLCLQSTYSDLTINVSSKRLPAHKFVLQARSDIWSEEYFQSNHELDWSDVEIGTAQNLLKWIYTDVIDIKQQDSKLIDLLRAAFKFKLDSLIGITERALMSTVTARTCVSLYCIGDEVGAKNLADYCSGLISAHWDELLPQDFKMMSLPLLYSMLKTKSKFPLHDAIKLRRSDVIKMMLDNEDEIKNALNTLSSSHKKYPLTLALLEKDVETAKILIEKGANVNAINLDGSSLLMKSIEDGDIFSSNFLLDSSCDINQTHSKSGDCVLHVICSLEDDQLRKEIMSQIGIKILQKPEVNVNIQNNDGISVLHHAISSNFTFMIDELLKMPNIDLNLQTKKMQGSLELALLSYKEDFSIAKKLIDRGGDTSICSESDDHLIHHLIKSDAETAALFLCEFVDLNKTNIHGETSLQIASQRNFSKLVAKMLKHGASPNTVCESDNGKSALHYAIEFNSVDVLKLFVNSRDYAIDFNLKTTDGNSPLNLALENKQFDLVPTLIAGGSNVNAKNSEGFTLLHQAIQNKSSETAVFLIQNGAFIDELTPDGLSPLLLAVNEECVDVVEILCTKGASMSLEGSKQSPLLVALENRQENIANILVNHGIDLDCWTETEDGTIQTLLHYFLTEMKDEFAASFLIKNGCDVDSPRQKQQNSSDDVILTRDSPLHLCCKLGLFTTVQNLIKAGANLNPQNFESQTPLHLAIQNKHEDIIQILLEQSSIDLKLRDKSGCTPFALTLAVRNHKIAQKILEKMPNAAEQMDSRGRNFLHLAILNEDIETILFLISIQVDVNSRIHDVNQLTPLMLAASCENEMIIRNLILAGARLNDRDSSQRTALHIACERGRIGAVEALIQNNCDFDAVDMQGDNALAIAMRESKIEIVRELLTETSINAENVNVKGRNSLHELCRCGRDNLAASICELFLECMPKFPINHPDIQGNTPLILAFMRGEGSLCRVLVKNNACLGFENNDGVSIFNYKLATNQLLVRLIDELTVEPPWSMAPCCQECRTKFTLTSRKHHCRSCGRSLCSSCSSNDIPIIKFQLNKPVRVCDHCFSIIQVGSI